MKNLKRRSIFTWIYAFILLIPMFTIAVRCLYVVINKNAYQSYSSTNVQNVSKVTSDNFLVENGTFTINSIVNTTGGNVTTPIFTYDWISVDWTTLISAPSNYNYNGFAVMTSGATANKFFLLYDNGVQVFEYHSGNIDSINNRLPITFTLSSYTSGTTNWFNFIDTSFYSISKGTIDNVFEYSIQQFVDKHGNGLINFFGLLEQYFMQSTTANSLYFTFANWCLNYVLLVSCVWLLFSVLMWFINYCNYMLNTSFRKGHGD